MDKSKGWVIFLRNAAGEFQRYRDDDSDRSRKLELELCSDLSELLGLINHCGSLRWLLQHLRELFLEGFMNPVKEKRALPFQTLIGYNQVTYTSFEFSDCPFIAGKPFEYMIFDLPGHSKILEDYKKTIESFLPESDEVSKGDLASRIPYFRNWSMSGSVSGVPRLAPGVLWDSFRSIRKYINGPKQIDESIWTFIDSKESLEWQESQRFQRLGLYSLGCELLVDLIEAEAKQTVAPESKPEQASGLVDGLSPDGLTLRWGGVNYPLSTTSASLVKLLFCSFNDGFQYLHENYLKTEGEFESDIRTMVRDAGLDSIVVREVGTNGKTVKGKWGLVDPKKVLLPH